MALTDSVPSAAFDVLQRNAQDVDKFVNTSSTFVNRVGNNIKSMPLLESEAQTAIDSLGFVALDPLTFETGATITSKKQLLEWAVADGGTGFHYYWSGALPKTVAAASTPATSGGTGEGAWLIQDDLEQRLADGTVDVGGATSDIVAKSAGINASEIKALTEQPDNQVIFVRDKFGGSFWRYKTSSRVIDTEAELVISFDDERSIVLDNGGYLVFDDALNDGVLKELESKNYASFIAKLYARDSAITYNCYGDSITYGQALADTVGATNRVGEATGFGDGSTYKHWQYDEAWPAVLQSQLNLYYATDCTVVNRGYSGSRAYSNYLAQRTPVSSDVALIMFGINETQFATSNGLNKEGIRTSTRDGVVAYKQAIKRYVIREILRGNTVVLMAPPNFASSVGWDDTTASSTKLTKAYTEALKSVALECGVHFVDMRNDILRGYAINRVTQENVHLNDVGHTVVGSRLASLFIGGFKNIERVRGGDKIVGRPSDSHVTNGSSSGATTPANATSYTPPFLSSAPTTIAVADTSPLVFSFYAEEDDLIVWPEIAVNNTTATIKLAYGYEQAEYALDSSIGKSAAYNAAAPASITASPLAEKSYTTASSVRKGQLTESVRDTSSMHIHIARKGYYTLTIENSGASGLLVDGLTFLDYESAKMRHRFASCSFNGVGGVVEQKKVLISSISRVSTGLYEVFFSIPAPDIYYGVSGVAMQNTIGSGVRLAVGIPAGSAGEVTVNKCRVEVFDTSGNRSDAEIVRLNFDFGYQ